MNINSHRDCSNDRSNNFGAHITQTGALNFNFESVHKPHTVNSHCSSIICYIYLKYNMAIYGNTNNNHVSTYIDVRMVIVRPGTEHIDISLLEVQYTVGIVLSCLRTSGCWHSDEDVQEHWWLRWFNRLRGQPRQKKTMPPY